ncbi:MAG: PH domain-containing protein [bacterium]|nr:PH domain-containing protein [bacterium]
MATEQKGTKKISVDHVNVRISISFLVLKLIAADVITTVVLVLLYSAIFQTGLQEWLPAATPEMGLVGIIALTVIESLLTVFVVLGWVSEYYEISSYGIAHKSGVIFKKVDRYGMQNIKQILISQGFFGKMLNYGTLTVFDWRLDKCAEMYAIHNPRRYLRILESILPNVDEHKSSFGSIEKEDDDEEMSA